MNKSFIGLALIGSLISISSCKKTSPISIDNDQVIQTPYSLFVANSFGHLLKTNDGEKYYTVYPSDGYGPKAILTSKNNLLVAKDNLHLSNNDGKNFYMVYNKMRTYDYQNFLVDAPSHNRIYVTSTEGKGIAYSENNGLTWMRDTAWADLLPQPFTVNSFAVLDNGTVFSFSNVNLILFSKPTATDKWTPVTIEGIFPVQESDYFISTDGVNLFLMDHSGKRPNYMSTNGGTFWQMINQGELPQNNKIYTAFKNQNGMPLIGTENSGIFRIENLRFIRNSNGLETNTSVYRILNKQNLYKNAQVKNFMFAATSTGVYRSSDNGVNWNRMTDTTFQHKYVAAY